MICSFIVNRTNENENIIGGFLQQETFFLAAIMKSREK